MHPYRAYLQTTTIAAGLLILGLIGACSSQPSRPLPVSDNPATAGSAHPAVSVAQQMVGVPYRYGGSSPRKGFDCSGLVHYSFGQAGLRTPRTAEAMFRTSFAVDPADLRQGDLLFFRIDGQISHVAIHVTGKTFIHAPSSGKPVGYDTLDNPYWRERLVKVGRLF